MAHTKTPQIEQFLNDVAVLAFGRQRKAGNCVKCGSKRCREKDFKDTLSFDEYKISFLCQVCQDEIYYEDPKDGNSDEDYLHYED